MLLLLAVYSSCICIKWIKEKIQTVLIVSDRSAYVISISCVLLSYYFFNLLAGVVYFVSWLGIKTYEYELINERNYRLWYDKNNCDGD